MFPKMLHRLSRHRWAIMLVFAYSIFSIIRHLFFWSSLSGMMGLLWSIYSRILLLDRTVSSRIGRQMHWRIILSAFFCRCKTINKLKHIHNAAKHYNSLDLWIVSYLLSLAIHICPAIAWLAAAQHFPAELYKYS